jgi:alpha-glucosidase
VGGEGGEPIMKRFIAGDRLFHTAYGFNFLYAESLSPPLIRSVLESWPDDGRTGWPSWAFSNHDAPRAVSRWMSAADRVIGAQLAMLLLVCLRGNIFLYQGEELGLTQAEIAFEDLRDPEAIANWPLTLGRDGARTPIPWVSEARYAGFSQVRPWLPIPQEHRPLAVDLQNTDTGSQLAVTRRFIALRNSCPALRIGSLKVLEATQTLLVIERRYRDARLLCVFNFGTAPHTPRSEGKWQILESVGDAQSGNLPPMSALIAQQL